MQVTETRAGGAVPGVAAAGTDPFGTGDDGSEPFIDTVLPGGIHAICADNQTAMRLQDGGKFRLAENLTAAPVQFPAGVFTRNSHGIANSLDDPIQDFGGNRSNLQRIGPAGSWCRPLPVPFAQSNPLASRAFWTPFALVALVVVVFLLSRGVKIPA